MRSLLASVLSLLLLSFPAFSQDKDQDQSKSGDVTIRSYTKLVQVPAVVTDKSGRPVRGLTKDDFILKEDGKQVTIATFQAATSEDDAPVAREKLPPGHFSNVAGNRPVERPIVIIVIDAANTPFLDQAQSRRQLIKFLSEKVQSDTLLSLMVISRSGARLIHEYTTDPKVLIEALRRVKIDSSIIGATATPGQSMTPAQGPAPANSDNSADAAIAREAQALDVFVNGGGDNFAGMRRAVYTDFTLSALRSIAQSYAGVPGRKSLIWAASNFPFFRDDPSSISSSDYTGRFLRTFELLNSANIAVYPIDAAGLIGNNVASLSSAGLRNPGGASQVIGSSQQTAGRGDTDLGQVNSAPNPIDNMKNVAELTGGIAYYGTNDLAGAMRKATEDSGGYYMLGYYLTGGANAKPGRHKLKVEVRKPGVNVRSRTRMYVSEQTLNPMMELMAALRTPMEFTNLPLLVKFDATHVNSGEPTPFEISLSPSNIELGQPDNTVDFTFLVEARDPQGKVLDRIDQHMTGKVHALNEFMARPFAYDNRLRPMNGPATVRFVVRDNNSGKMGSVIVETQGKAQ